jgi:hypothetical protein
LAGLVPEFGEQKGRKGGDDVSAFDISGEPLLFANLSRAITFVTESRKPAVGRYPDWGRVGLLMSYSTDPVDGFRQLRTAVAHVRGFFLLLRRDWTITFWWRQVVLSGGA